MRKNRHIVYNNEFLERYIVKLDSLGYPCEHKADAIRQVNSVFEIIKDALYAGESVSRQGFGKFEIRNRKARKGRNPRTGEEIKLPAITTVGFKASKHFFDDDDD